MKFAGLIKQSLVDYPGEIAAVLFTWGCNFRCPFCHNGHLGIKPGRLQECFLEEELVLDFLAERRGFLDGLVVTGGEPTLDKGLPEFLRQVKKLDYLVKLDTNGTNPVLVQQMMAEKLLDYVAMDIKAPLEYKKYQQACGGKLTSEEFFNVRNAVNLLQNASIKVEFRTTVVPVLHTPEDIEAIANYIKGAPLYTLQQFNPEITLENSYMDVAPYNKQEMQALADNCQPYVRKLRVINL